MKKMNLKFIVDPGHGWLSVSHKQVVDLGLVDQISHYSYMNLTRVFLEEDRDAVLFIETAKAQGYEVIVKEPSGWSDRPSWVRSLGQYNPEYLKHPLKEGDMLKVPGVYAPVKVLYLSHFSKTFTVVLDDMRFKIPYSNPFNRIIERVGV